jgi:hypothetical protein
VRWLQALLEVKKYFLNHQTPTTERGPPPVQRAASGSSAGRGRGSGPARGVGGSEVGFGPGAGRVVLRGAVSRKGSRTHSSLVAAAVRGGRERTGRARWTTSAALWLPHVVVEKANAYLWPPAGASQPRPGASTNIVGCKVIHEKASKGRQGIHRDTGEERDEAGGRFGRDAHSSYAQLAAANAPASFRGGNGVRHGGKDSATGQAQGLSSREGIPCALKPSAGVPLRTVPAGRAARCRRGRAGESASLRGRGGAASTHAQPDETKRRSPPRTVPAVAFAVAAPAESSARKARIVSANNNKKNHGPLRVRWLVVVVAPATHTTNTP